MAHGLQVRIWSVIVQPSRPSAHGFMIPAIEMRQSSCGNRDEEKRHKRQHIHCSLKLTANHHPPCTTREVLNHQEGHSAERNPEPQHESQQIRAEELLAGGWQKRQNQRGDTEKQANAKRALQNRVRDFWCCEFSGIGAHRAHFCSSCWVDCGSGTGKVAPDPGSSISGAGDGTGCPATSACAACWL